MLSFYSTSDVARKAGITRITLQDWIKKGKFPAPKLARVGGVKVRLWTALDLARLQALRKAIYHKKEVTKGRTRRAIAQRTNRSARGVNEDATHAEIKFAALRLDFIKATLDVALTLVAIAQRSDNDERFDRLRRQARNGYEMVNQFLGWTVLTVDDKAEISAKLTQLKSDLTKIGERFGSRALRRAS